MRSRYRSGGVRGLVDGRVTRPSSTYRRTDERVVAAVLDALDGGETKRSTGTRDRLRRQVEMLLVQRHGDGAVAMPSKATFNRLVTALSTGQHTFGSAKTRRSAANRPTGPPFTATWASRPGQHVQIDTTPLDVLAVFDDGSARRVELTAAVDVATRTIAAGVLRPVGTKAVDASMLLARMLVPEPMRPGWAETLRMSVSRLPYRSLADIDIRMEQAAAKPVIVPETIGCDRGKVYLSETFLRSCQTLGMSVQPSHPRTPTDNSVIERTFSSINTLFCQYVAGYVGRDVGRRGAHVEDEAAWSLAQLQDLFDEWVIHWQRRPHDGLRSPDSGQAVSPNEMYAVLVSAAGYLPLMLSGEDYIELLPSQWRAINDYGGCASTGARTTIAGSIPIAASIPVSPRTTGGLGKSATTRTTCRRCSFVTTTKVVGSERPGRICRWCRLRSRTLPGVTPARSSPTPGRQLNRWRPRPRGRWRICWIARPRARIRSRRPGPRLIARWRHVPGLRHLSEPLSCRSICVCSTVVTTSTRTAAVMKASWAL